MQKVLFVLCLFFSLALCGAEGKRVVSVEKFLARPGSGATPHEIDLLYDEILNIVANTRKFTIVEREQIQQVLREQAAVDAGMTDGKGPESNKIQAAGYIMNGTIQRVEVSEMNIPMSDGTVKVREGVVEIMLKFVNAENGKVLGTKKVEGRFKAPPSFLADSDGAIARNVKAQAIKEASQDAVNALVERAYPVTVLAVNSRFVTVNLTDEQTQIGDAYEVWELGEAMTDPGTGQPLGFSEDLVGQVTVSRTGPKFSKCEPVGGLKLDQIKKGMILRKAPKQLVAPEAESGRGLVEW